MELFTSAALDQGWMGIEDWDGAGHIVGRPRWDILGHKLDLTWRASILRLAEYHLRLDSSTERARCKK